MTFREITKIAKCFFESPPERIIKNKINPRIYFKEIVQLIHQSQEALTPAEYAKIADSKK